jgi:hypothetical protein
MGLTLMLKTQDWHLLYMVDNCSCIGVPLGTPEGSKLHYQMAPRKETGILQKK